MATIDYPAELPAPLRQGYGLTHGSPMMRTELQSGRARQRRRYTSVPSVAAVAWHLTQPQAQTFEAWFRWSLLDGAEPFNVRIRTPLGLRDYEARFAEMYAGPELVGIDRWQISAKVELLERQTLPDGYQLAPGLVAQSDVLDRALNAIWVLA
jgi:hypothetical protein